MSAPRFSLLILEDEPAHVEAIRRAFASANPGVEIRVASSLRAYCELVAARAPDIVLMDLNLPDGNTHESLILLSEKHPFPVLVMTSMGNEEVAVAAMKAGAIDYVVKSPEAFANMPRSAQRALREWNLLQERKRAEEELRNFRFAVEQSGTPIFITDPTGKIEYANPAFEKTTGYTLAEAAGKTPRILKSGEQSAEFYRNLWATVLAGKIWRGQFHNRRKDSSLYWESATISPVQNDLGEIVHFIAIKEDITYRKAIEGRLQEALLDAQAAVKAKSEFLAVMSHELRTPLNGVLGFAELLADSRLDDKQKAYSQAITSSGKHLLSVVNDILDFSSMENGTLLIEESSFLIADLLRSAVGIPQNAASEKGLEIRCEKKPGVPERIVGDERRILQILLNLLGNAVKFTEGGSVTLRVAPASGGDRPFLDFSVEDTGIGMSPETLKVLFKPFSQADSTINRRFGGTGLGLAISRRLAEAMGGKITVASLPGQGSTFTFRFPVGSGSFEPPEPVEKSCAEGSPAPRPDAGTVLVVEDELISSELAGEMLDALGYRAVFAFNGQEAVQTFEPGKFSAILMDMAMPVMNGLVAAAKIREIEAGVGRVLMIAMTGNVLREDIERCLAAGMDDFLTKPFKKSELAAKLAPA
ncbi:MAG: response regulator [Verrucomicrobiae bacterium]